jgi:hypothetical protein
MDSHCTLSRMGCEKGNNILILFENSSDIIDSPEDLWYPQGSSDLPVNCCSEEVYDMHKSVSVHSRFSLWLPTGKD